MADISELKTRVVSIARREQEKYAQGADRPLGGYLATMAAYGTLITVGSALARVTGRRVPDTIGPWDLFLASVATHKLSRLLTKESVTSPLRAPFTSFQGPGAPAEVTEQVRGEGLRHAVGELVTCPFCMGMWAATGFTGGLVLAPRQTRLAAATLCALNISDFLQFAYAAAEKHAAHHPGTQGEKQ
jgi:hypothetical protein